MDHPSLQGLSAVVVDDSPAVLQLLTGTLERFGFTRIEHAVNGSDAMDVLTSSQPLDCLIADVYLPKASGLQLLHAIRTGSIRGVPPNLCVLLITGDLSPQALKAARDLDVNGMLQKPFRAAALSDELIRARSHPVMIDMARYALIDPATLSVARLGEDLF